MKKILAAILSTFILIGGGLYFLWDQGRAKTTMASQSETVKFTAADEVEVTADLYLIDNEKAPFIILFHQAFYSRGEYREIAPKLNAMGYNCLAVDQRSGNSFSGIRNETHKSATAMKLSTGFEDAYPDLEAALKYVKENYQPETILVWGSSYSSSLAFVLAANHSEDIDGLLAFSPGEYFLFEGKQIEDYAKAVKCPVFITSAKSEGKDWKNISEAVTADGSTFFLPTERGVHGSSALMDKTANHEEYWEAVKKFFENNTFGY